jgi:competence protein ComEC
VRLSSFLLVVLFSGVLSVNWGHSALKNQLPEHYSGQIFDVQGCVSSLVSFKSRSYRFEFEPSLMAHSESGLVITTPKRIRLSWFKTHDQPERIPKLGECWQLRVKLKRPHGSVNPGGFDYERWLLTKGIGATGYVRTHSENHFIKYSGWDYLGAYRQYLVAHLLAISGLHIGLAAAFGYFLIGCIARLLSVRWPHHVFTPYWAIVGSVVFAGIYAALAGFSLPAQRALVMLLSLSIWQLWGRNHSVWQAWWLSMALILACSPLSGFGAGFWMTYMAVAALIAGFQAPVWQNRNLIHRLIWAQLLVFIGLLLPLLWFGLGVSGWSLLVNLVAIPWVGLMVVPPLLLGALLITINEWLGLHLWYLADWSIQRLLDALTWLSDWESQRQAKGILRGENTYSSFINGQDIYLSPSLVILSAVLLAFYYAPKKLPAKATALLGIVLILIAQPVEKKPQLWVLDVGQGLSVLVVTNEGSVLFDAGPAYGSGFDAGSSIVLPSMNRLGVKRLNTVVISHGDSDHSGGWNSVANKVPVGKVWAGEVDKLKGAVDVKYYGLMEPCSTDQYWMLGGVHFDLLANPLSIKNSAKGNNRSCVLLVSLGDERVLVPGDIEALQERYFTKHPKLQLGVTGLVMPHHGSKTSSSERFLRLMSPTWAIASAGYLSRYGHPHPSVVTRYNKKGIHILSTAEMGALRFLFTENQLPEGYRDLQKRYWR